MAQIYIDPSTTGGCGQHRWPLQIEAKVTDRSGLGGDCKLHLGQDTIVLLLRDKDLVTLGHALAQAGAELLAIAALHSSQPTREEADYEAGEDAHAREVDEPNTPY